MSSFVVGSFEGMAGAARDLTGIGSAIKSANAAATVSTTQVAPAATDDVSAAIAEVFGGYAQQYQAVMARAGLFHDQFVQRLSTGAGTYAATEAANAALSIGTHPYFVKVGVGSEIKQLDQDAEHRLIGVENRVARRI